MRLIKKPLHIRVHATVAQQVGVTGLADGLVISRAGLEFSAGKLLVLPQPLRLGGQDGQDCSRLLEVHRVTEHPGVSSEGRKEGREVFFGLPKRFLGGKFVIPTCMHPKVGGLLWLVVRDRFLSVLGSTQLVAVDKTDGWVQAPEALSLASPMG